mgnify:CR=1 FL=1
MANDSFDSWGLSTSLRDGINHLAEVIAAEVKK